MVAARSSRASYVYNDAKRDNRTGEMGSARLRRAMARHALSSLAAPPLARLIFLEDDRVEHRAERLHDVGRHEARHRVLDPLLRLHVERVAVEEVDLAVPSCSAAGCI